MPSRRLATLAVLLLAALAACGDGGGGRPPSVGTSSPIPPAGGGTGALTGSGAPAGPPGPGVPTWPGGFSTTDLAWLQLAIAMDERILRVIALVPGRTSEPEVDSLAGRLGTAHRETLARLRALHDRSGGPTANPHEGHDMPGMATGAQLDAMRRARGQAAVSIFAELMRAHLDQSVQLARAERDHGTELATRAIAGEIERSRAEYRTWVDATPPVGRPDR